MKIFVIPYEIDDGVYEWVIVNLRTLCVLVKADNKAKALAKQDSRHLDGRQADDCPGLWFEPPKSLEDQYIEKELRQELHHAMQSLTETQMRRIRAHFFDGQTYRQIAADEGVDWTSVRESIYTALKKMKKMLVAPPQNGF